MRSYWRHIVTYYLNLNLFFLFTTLSDSFSVTVGKNSVGQLNSRTSRRIPLIRRFRLVHDIHANNRKKIHQNNLVIPCNLFGCFNHCPDKLDMHYAIEQDRLKLCDSLTNIKQYNHYQSYHHGISYFRLVILMTCSYVLRLQALYALN